MRHVKGFPEFDPKDFEHLFGGLKSELRDIGFKDRISRILEFIELLNREIGRDGYLVCGSFGLKSLGLLDREPGDLDIAVKGPISHKLRMMKDVFRLSQEVKIEGNNDEKSDKSNGPQFSEMVNTIDGETINRMGIHDRGLNICIFEVPEKWMENSKKVTVNGVTFRVQDVKWIKKAKEVFAEKNSKHKDDLLDI
jgi:hypothetical protein